MSIFYIRGVAQTAEQIAKLTQYELFDTNIHCMRNSLFKYYPNNTMIWSPKVLAMTPITSNY